MPSETRRRAHCSAAAISVFSTTTFGIDDLFDEKTFVFDPCPGGTSAGTLCCTGGLR